MSYPTQQLLLRNFESGNVAERSVEYLEKNFFEEKNLTQLPLVVGILNI